MANNLTTPDWREHYNINPKLKAYNEFDNNENPAGGTVRLALEDGDNSLYVRWQEGPRGIPDSDELLPPNGAFIEDVLWAALQRLEFFQKSKYSDRGNAIAITKIEEALAALKNRQLERSYRGVEGKNIV